MTEATTTLPSVEQWERENPDGATPLCPICGRHLGIRPALFNISGIALWICDEGMCNDNAQISNGR